MSPLYRRQRARFYDETTAYALDTGLRDLRLWAVPTPTSFGLNNTARHIDTIIRIATEWQRQGWGALDGADKGWPVFTFNAKGISVAKRRQRMIKMQIYLRRVITINWNALGAVAAIVAAVAAIASAYFSYMALNR